MRTIRVGGTIKRPAEEVFGVLSDPENAPKWSLNALEEKLTSPGPVGVGSTRRAVVKTLGGRTAENHAVCTEFEPNRRLVWRSTSAPIPFQVGVDFTPVDGGTRVDSTWAWEPKGLLRLASPILDLMFKRAMQKDVENLRVLMEAGDL
ncbi:MAG: SRPBCC family protein [Chloroflexota bacterium]|nr:SRPBCC family protein [Chloroflexota bacterium]